MTEMNMIEAINFTLRQEMEKDEDVLILGEDVGRNGGVFRATDGLVDTFGERRVVDTPLAESGIIGTAVGMAVRGLKPVAEIQFLGFIYEAMDQIAAQAARIRFRSAGNFHAPMVIRAPYSGGVKTPELHSDSLEALFMHSAGIKVIMPSSPSDAKGLLNAAIEDPDPVLFLEPMKLYRAIRENVEEERYTIEIGKANILKEGSDITLISWGSTMAETKKAVQMLEENGYSIELIDLRTIVPLDEETIIDSVMKTSRCVVVHEAVKSAGVGAEISAIINEKALFYISAPVLRVTGYDSPYPVATVENDWIPSVDRIVREVKHVWELSLD
ncbi:alpha-ketoacid dehydrogenase subunit beta [Salicibibacter halophilus]|uniref:Alpha-ketoacid dehydrogenase subunit beta n=1 Tax=Salicibibacter halophilus TaxID=2502791 RepID=A0A514LF50_9BACI|nr:alpha-ketoacid dehydrogenase subunit beta [Salicibibacter halophilus]QDI90480.1 alpha-ketoacid dehydrogenase subunit beta [Salicibibacter halophilus]